MKRMQHVKCKMQHVKCGFPSFYILLFTFYILFAGSGRVFADDMETVVAVPANDFLNSIGVNTSINTRGENINRTVEYTKYLGVRWIRSGPPDGLYVRATHFKTLYERNRIRFSMLLNTNGDPNESTDYPGGIPYTIQAAKDIINAAGTPDIMLAFEGCNEPNNWGITYQGEKAGTHYEKTKEGKDTAIAYSWKPLARYHRDFYAAVKADDALKHLPVWSMTDTGAAWENVGLHFLEIPENATGVDPEFPAGTKYADFACIHNYFVSNAVSPRTTDQTWRAADPLETAGNTLKANFGKTWNKGYQGYTDEQLKALPRVTTETGTTIDGYNVTEEYQALTYLSCYLAQFKQGIKHTAIYILRDRIDEGGNQTFGFYSQGTNEYIPRLSAHYLHNMTSILQDTISIQTPGTLDYALSSRIGAIYDLLLQKNDETLVLVIWGERYSRTSTAKDITVTFGETFDKINVYNPAQYKANDPEIGLRPVQTHSNVNQIQLPVWNHPYIIEINPKSTGIDNPDIEASALASFYYSFENNSLILNSNVTLKNIGLFDLTGKNRLQQNNVGAGITNLDISCLNAGSYILRLVSTDGRVENRKFVKL